MIRRSLVAAALYVLCLSPIGAYAQPTSAVEPESALVPGFFELITEIGTDFRNVASREHLPLLATGSGLALLGGLHDASMEPVGTYDTAEEKLQFGSELGSATFHVGASLATYVVARVMERPAFAHVGADLLQAQMVNGVLTGVLKHTIRRTRPNGHNLSFPSGHTSAAFASATVLERHFGWKVGAPAYAVSAYAAASRVHERQHYLSDVLFGATIGIIAGRSVSVGHGRGAFEVSPFLRHGGGGVMLVRVAP